MLYYKIIYKPDRMTKLYEKYETHYKKMQLFFVDFLQMQLTTIQVQLDT